jgi:hypothetical protein
MTSLDPQAQDLLDVMEVAGVAPIHTMSVDDARERMRATLIPRGAPLELKKSVVALIVVHAHISARLLGCRPESAGTVVSSAVMSRRATARPGVWASLLRRRAIASAARAADGSR